MVVAGFSGKHPNPLANRSSWIPGEFLGHQEARTMPDDSPDSLMWWGEGQRWEHPSPRSSHLMDPDELPPMSRAAVGRSPEQASFLDVASQT